MRRRLAESISTILWAQTLVASVAFSDDLPDFLGADQIRDLYATELTGAEVVPTLVQEAFVAAEDRNFFKEEWPISTVTQQLARRFTAPEGGMVSRKLSELATVQTIEATLERPEILAWYLQGIYLGRGCYGVKAAANAYFGKVPEALTLAEAAMLAALPTAPTVFDPSRNPEKALGRRNFVLSEMAKAGFVEDAAAQAAAGDTLGVVEPSQRCDG
jgi:membrane carboxypeptidase/penicillin-binding protein